MNYFKNIFKFVLNHRRFYYRCIGLLFLFAGISRIEILDFIIYLRFHNDYLFAYLASVVLSIEPRNSLLSLVALILTILALYY